MTDRPQAPPAADPRLSPAFLRAWGGALVKTGAEHLDLSMVRRGKKILAEAAKPAAAVPPNS